MLKVIYFVNSTVKNRELIHFQLQCVLSTTSSPPAPTAKTTLLDIDKLRLHSLEAHSNSVPAFRPLTYIGTVGPSAEVRIYLFRIDVQNN